MDDENTAVGILLLFVLIGGVWFVQSSNVMGILLGLVGVLLFFGAMLVAGENSDFDAMHEW